MTEEEILWDQAEALGVLLIVGDDLETLLEAVHEHEGKLMELRHRIERHLIKRDVSPNEA